MEQTPLPTTTDAPAASPQHSARGHHPYSPSSLGTLERSPCFVNRQSDNEASVLGTLQHEAVETQELDERLTDEHAAAVDRAIQMAANLRQALVDAGSTVYEVAEKYLPIDDVVVDGWKGTTGGYPDRVLVYSQGPGKYYVYILDWKFGRYAVTPAKDNRQGHAYLLGVQYLLATGNFLPDLPPGGVVGATVVFFSPHRNEPPNQHEFAETDLLGLYDDLVQIVFNARWTRERIARDGHGTSNLASFRMHLDTCKFCADLGKCPAVALLASGIASRYPTVTAPEDIVGVSFDDVEKTARGVKIAGIVKDWAEAYRQRITAAAFEDKAHTPAGYRLIATYPTKVLNGPGLFEYLLKRFGDKVVYGAVKVPLTNFDKIVNQATPRGGKDAAVEQFRSDMQNAGLTEPTTVPTLSLRMK